MAQRTARRVVDYIKTNLDKDLSIAELSLIAGMSASHFSRNFRSTFGHTPHSFVLQTRIDLARDLLARGQYSVLDVAQLCGFKTQQHFSRVFTNLTGISPGKYRRG